MDKYFDRYGNPISRGRWMVLMDADNRVVWTEFDSGSVSTIWIGRDYCMFETAVFYDDDRPNDTYTWATLADAHAGHARIVAEVS